jgi:hypothetical protein
MSSPQQHYPADKAPLLQDADEDEFDEEPLGRTAIDRYGRRSMAFRVKKTGQIITSTGKAASMSLMRPYADRIANRLRDDRGKDDGYGRA